MSDLIWVEELLLVIAWEKGQAERLRLMSKQV